MHVTTDPTQGGPWLGFFQGVVYFRDGQLRASYSAADGLGRGRVYQLRVDREDALWAATDGGLSRLKNGQIATGFVREANGSAEENHSSRCPKGNRYVRRVLSEAAQAAVKK